MTSPPLGAALAMARRIALPAAAERVPLEDLLGRTLAEDVVARVDLPAGDGSAMDGWAVRAGDLPGALRIVGESRAGAPWGGAVGHGQAVRISTGALVPAGADTILRAEEGSDDGHVVTTSATPAAGRDIRLAAGDLRRGRVVLRAGTRLRGHQVGAVAAAGHAGAMCRRRAVAAIVTTGSELIAPGGAAGHGTVFDSNRHGLRAQLEDAGARVASGVTVEDDALRVREALAEAIAGAEILVVAGGLSVGRHDHVRGALHDLGLRPAFSRMAMRPGRPTTAGLISDRRVLAVPGNPAAAAVAVHLIGRALLGTEAPWEHMALSTPWTSSGRLDEVLRCRERDGMAEPVASQGSGSISSLAGAQMLAWLPWGRRAFPAGSVVAVSRL